MTCVQGAAPWLSTQADIKSSMPAMVAKKPPSRAWVCIASDSMTRPSSWPAPWCRISSGSSLRAPCISRRLSNVPAPAASLAWDQIDTWRGTIRVIRIKAQANSQSRDSWPSSAPRPSIHHDSRSSAKETA